MPTRRRQIAEFGALVLGETSYGEGQEHAAITTTVAPSTSIKTTAIGFKGIGGRVQDKPETITVVAPAGGRPNLEIFIYSRSGVHLGILTTEAERTTIRSCRFSNGKNGCEDGEFVLGELPSFPIVEFSVAKIRFAHTSFFWYAGTIRRVPEPGATPDKGYTYTLEPLRKQLDETRDERIVAAPVDVGSIVETLVTETVIADTGIVYNPAKLDNVTGVLTASSIDLSKYPLKKIFETLATMGDCFWGIDGDGEFFFDAKADNPIQKSLFVGRDMREFKPEKNVDGVKNSIVVRRQKGMGSGGAGWVVEGVFSDATSIATWGFRELIYSVPGNFGAVECGVVGNNLLAEKKDPQVKATSAGHIIVDGNSYIGPNERYRIIAEPTTYEVETDVEESLTGWAKTGTGDSVIAIDTQNLIDGGASLKVTYSSALNDEYAKAVSLKGNVKRLLVYVKSRLSGAVLQFGAGAAAWTENVFSCNVAVRNSFQLFAFDLTSANLSSIGEIGFRITDTTTVPTNKTIYIDRVVVEMDDFRHFDLVTSRVLYEFSPDKLDMKVEWGDIPTKMESYISSLFAQAEEANFNSEAR